MVTKAKTFATERAQGNLLTLELERGHVLVYVGGAHPYIWIGDEDGTFFGAVDVADLREFLKGRRPSS